MEENFSKEKGCLSSAGEDLISKLPDSLISQILLYLSTKDIVRTSVLSKRWRSLWFLIPGLDLDSSEFPDYNAFVSFIDRFLDFSREEKSCLHKLKLSIWKGKADPPCVMRWMDFVVRGKLQRLDVECDSVNRECLEVMPLNLYICETLIYLRLQQVAFPSFESVSLPCLKTMCLEDNVYPNVAALESLISSCPVLEDLSIVRRGDDNVKVLRVHSQTLLTLNIECYFGVVDADSGVLIDAPRLKYLKLEDGISDSKIIKNSSGSLAKVSFGDFYLKDSAVDSFFTSISGVSDMKISSYAFKFMENIMPLPQFCNLSCLEVELYSCSLENLPRLLESCPNLKSLILSILYDGEREEIRLSSVPQCLLSSLEFVEIESIFSGRFVEYKVARYFVENSILLKKLVLRSIGSNSMLEEDLLALTMRSTTCQIVHVAHPYLDF